MSIFESGILGLLFGANLLYRNGLSKPDSGLILGDSGRGFWFSVGCYRFRSWLAGVTLEALAGLERNS